MKESKVNRNGFYFALSTNLTANPTNHSKISTGLLDI